jgi:PadR family transcriptional regulator PadR
LILAVLSEEELYGYEIGARIRERSSSFIDPGEGWLYPALHKLELEGALEATWRDSEIGPKRRYYRLTRKGSRMLAAQSSEWESFARSVHRVTRGLADA